MLDRFLSSLEPELINQASRWPSIAQRSGGQRVGGVDARLMSGGGDGGGV